MGNLPQHKKSTWVVNDDGPYEQFSMKNLQYMEHGRILHLRPTSDVTAAGRFKYKQLKGDINFQETRNGFRASYSTDDGEITGNWQANKQFYNCVYESEIESGRYYYAILHCGNVIKSPILYRTPMAAAISLSSACVALGLPEPNPRIEYCMQNRLRKDTAKRNREKWCMQAVDSSAAGGHGAVDAGFDARDLGGGAVFDASFDTIAAATGEAEPVAAESLNAIAGDMEVEEEPPVAATSETHLDQVAEPDTADVNMSEIEESWEQKASVPGFGSAAWTSKASAAERVQSLQMQAPVPLLAKSEAEVEEGELIDPSVGESELGDDEATSQDFNSENAVASKERKAIQDTGFSFVSNSAAMPETQEPTMGFSLVNNSAAPETQEPAMGFSLMNSAAVAETQQPSMGFSFVSDSGSPMTDVPVVSEPSSGFSFIGSSETAPTQSGIGSESFDLSDEELETSEVNIEMDMVCSSGDEWESCGPESTITNIFSAVPPPPEGFPTLIGSGRLPKYTTRTNLFGASSSEEARFLAAIKSNKSDFENEINIYFSIFRCDVACISLVEDFVEITISGKQVDVSNAFKQTDFISTSYGNLFSLDARYRPEPETFACMEVIANEPFAGYHLLDWCRELIPDDCPVAPVCVISQEQKWFDRTKIGAKTVEWRWSRPISQTSSMEADGIYGHAVIINKSDTKSVLFGSIVGYIRTRSKDQIIRTPGSGFDCRDELDDFLALYPNNIDLINDDLLKKDIIGIRLEKICDIDPKVWGWDLSQAKNCNRNPCFQLNHKHFLERKKQIEQRLGR